MELYKHDDKDQIAYVDEPDTLGKILFTFDNGKTVFNFWTDYPQKLTRQQVEIFKNENPVLAALK